MIDFLYALTFSVVPLAMLWLSFVQIMMKLI